MMLYFLIGLPLCRTIILSLHIILIRLLLLHIRMLLFSSHRLPLIVLPFLAPLLFSSLFGFLCLSWSPSRFVSWILPLWTFLSFHSIICISSIVYSFFRQGEAVCQIISIIRLTVSCYGGLVYILISIDSLVVVPTASDGRCEPLSMHSMHINDLPGEKQNWTNKEYINTVDHQLHICILAIIKGRSEGIACSRSSAA